MGRRCGGYRQLEPLIAIVGLQRIGERDGHVVALAVRDGDLHGVIGQRRQLRSPGFKVGVDGDAVIAAQFGGLLGVEVVEASGGVAGRDFGGGRGDGGHVRFLSAVGVAVPAGAAAAAVRLTVVCPGVRAAQPWAVGRFGGAHCGFNGAVHLLSPAWAG